MAQITRTAATAKLSPTSIFALASWRFRTNWLLLLVMTCGTIIALVFACLLPLLSEVTMTAGLRNTLQTNDENSWFNIFISPHTLSTNNLKTFEDRTKPTIQDYAGNYLAPSRQLFMESSFFRILKGGPSGKYSIRLVTTSLQSAAPHIKLVQGRLPKTPGAFTGELEVLISEETAKRWEVSVGSVVRQMYSSQDQKWGNNAGNELLLNVRVVGIFNQTSLDTSYWHGYQFEPKINEVTEVTYYTMFTDNTLLLSVLDKANQQKKGDPLTFPTNLVWYYQLDASRLTIYDLEALIEKLSLMQDDLNKHLSELRFWGDGNIPAIESYGIGGESLHGDITSSILEQYRERAQAIRLPALILAGAIIALLLLFVAMMVDLLIDRQTGALAILRSRGASGLQIFSALLLQGFLLTLVSLIIGLPLAYLAVSLVARAFLTAEGVLALNVVTSQPVQALQRNWSYPTVVAVAILLTIGLSLLRVLRMDVMALRRAESRPTRSPFWMRFHLDIALALIAFGGYALSLYLNSTRAQLDERAQTLVTGPLTLIAPTFVIIGLLLLFLRLFPWLLKLSAQLATRSRGAITVLALAQMARSPYRALRTALLLTLALALAIFSQVSMASQEQRILDLTNYQYDADLSGYLASATSVNTAELTQQYRRLPGVQAASLGSINTGTVAQSSVDLTLQLRGVDATTFAQTAHWSNAAVQQQATLMLQQLAGQREQITTSNEIGAIIDETTANALHLETGSTFQITPQQDASAVPQITFPCKVVGKLPHIAATLDDSDGGTGGVLFDYQSYRTLATKERQKLDNLGSLLSLNYVWLRTSDDPSAVAATHTALNNNPFLYLNTLRDRRAFIDTLRRDPLNTQLNAILQLGTLATLLLALVGGFLTSWQSASLRTTNFAILRALGTTPQQVTRVLIWEQAVIYLIALLLGIGSGLWLCISVLPQLLFTSMPIVAGETPGGLSNEQLFALQNLLPLQVVYPLSVTLACVALLLICLLGVWTMARVILHASTMQVLRLNED